MADIDDKDVNDGNKAKKGEPKPSKSGNTVTSTTKKHINSRRPNDSKLVDELERESREITDFDKRIAENPNLK